MLGDEILSQIRGVVMIVSGDGVIEDVRGGYGGFFGLDLESLTGTSVFDHVAPGDVDRLATYFIDSAETSLETATLTLPFRVHLLDSDGIEQPVDVVPTGIDRGDGPWTWVVLIVPVALSASVVRSLEAEMAGAPRGRVKELLTEELAVDNAHYTSRWFLVELPEGGLPAVSTSRAADLDLAQAVQLAVAEAGWRPWGGVEPADTVALDPDSIPEPVRAELDARGWRRASVTPVYVGGVLTAAYLLFGRVPESYDPTTVTANVRDGFHRLVDVTALLLARWRDQDRLVAAATRDPLTGLANRDALADALAEAGPRTALLYVDVDRFKDVNDRHGHDVGDRLLCEVARRIVSACRPVDVVARFGGDEFVVLLHDVDDYGAREIGERIVSQVEAPLETTGSIEQISVSVGLAEFEHHDDAVIAADRAMLQAKREGRARLVRAEPRDEGRDS